MTLALDRTIGLSDRPSAMSRPRSDLARSIAALSPVWHSDWAWDRYKDSIVALSRDLALKRLCEIGGGRDPLLDTEEVERLGVEFTLNDISQKELDCAPRGYPTACFDIAGDIRAANVGPGSYDLMFSRMVFEHVNNVPQAWWNIHRLLSPGGVALAFFPTLYALPFLANHLMPERLSSGFLKLFFPNRRDDGNDPKFPAVYDHCRGDDRTHLDMLRPIGFSETIVMPFWGHRYLRRVPGLREIDDRFNAIAARRDWRKFTTYAYVIVRK